MSFNWRHLVSLTNIEACKIAEEAKSMPLYNAVKDFLKEYVPDIPTECPVFAKLYLINYTHNALNDPTDIIGQFVSNKILPNGEYRNVLKIYNKKY
jgi:hypothetical protein